MNHSEFNLLLQHSYRDQESIRRNVRLPSEGIIRVGGDIGCTTLFMKERAVQANMQTDGAAFEGWAVVLMAWCGVQQIAVNWDEPVDIRNPHYQRFLYRLEKFQELFGPEAVQVVSADHPLSPSYPTV